MMKLPQLLHLWAADGGEVQPPGSGTPLPHHQDGPGAPWLPREYWAVGCRHPATTNWAHPFSVSNNSATSLHFSSPPHVENTRHKEPCFQESQRQPSLQTHCSEGKASANKTRAAGTCSLLASPPVPPTRCQGRPLP